VGLLSWSAGEADQSVEPLAIVHELDAGVVGGGELIDLGRAAIRPARDRGRLDAVAAVIGLPAALDAAAVAANFQIMNRVVDATGLSIGRHAQELQRDTIGRLGLARFPHAGSPQPGNASAGEAGSGDDLATSEGESS
jgi:hypothetical protein